VVQVNAPSPPLVLVTGASGFVGSALCAALPAAGYAVRRAVRTAQAAAPNDVVVGDIGSDTDWRQALGSVDSIVHLAARTHVLHETSCDPLAEYRRINVGGTVTLAQDAAKAGTRRLVFVSSVKVHGERTHAAPFRDTDVPQPEDAYGATKLEAEEHLRAQAADSGLEAIVLRPPLVYGPGAKGNFLRLVRLVDSRLPLPLASIENRRSLIYVGNLVSAILASLRVSCAKDGTYLVSDADALSTPMLIRAIARALNVEARLFPCPVSVLRLLARATGKTAEFSRLTQSLEIDSSRIRRELDWRPPFTVVHGLADMARWYRAHRHGAS
jgi:UDP-N-acetyl-alpha-D-quinovosamine dehydrogenase